MCDVAALPSAAFALGLSSLPEVGPARLRALLDGRDAATAWREVAGGGASDGPAAALMGPDPAALARRWADAAVRVDLVAMWSRHRERGIGVADRDDAAYPGILRADPYGPAVLLWSGSLAALDGPRVAIVGTRDCTHTGRVFASTLGHELAEAGVRVVSGLALGIDGAAHAGALAAGSAPPVAVVGSGLDVIYPRRHAGLWSRVASRGVVLSEHALGTRPAGWHFPARNRIIAALAHVVVVVESHEHGGALQTATEAAERGREVLAVPGSVHSPASRGTNALLRDAGVCCGAEDVLTLLGMIVPQKEARERRMRPRGDDEAVLDAIGFEPCATETIVLRTGLALGTVALALDRLEAAGWIARRGSWSERVASDRADRGATT